MAARWYTVLFSLVVIPAQAAIIDFGDITLDTNTGLEWLDVSLTRSYSFDQVLAKTQDSNDFLFGWSFATGAQFDNLILNFGLKPTTPECVNGFKFCNLGIPYERLDLAPDNKIIEKIIQTLGDTTDAYWDEINWWEDVNPNGAGSTYGLLSDSPSKGVVYTALVFDHDAIFRSNGSYLHNYVDRVETHFHTWNTDSKSPHIGSFLVRNATVSVSEPSAILLFSIGLILLILKRMLNDKSLNIYQKETNFLHAESKIFVSKAGS